MFILLGWQGIRWTTGSCLGCGDSPVEGGLAVSLEGEDGSCEILPLDIPELVDYKARLS